VNLTLALYNAAGRGLCRRSCTICFWFFFPPLLTLPPQNFFPHVRFSAAYELAVYGSGKSCSSLMSYCLPRWVQLNCLELLRLFQTKTLFLFWKYLINDCKSHYVPFYTTTFSLRYLLLFDRILSHYSSIFKVAALFFRSSSKSL